MVLNGEGKMFHSIDFLVPEEVKTLMQLSETLSFEDGKATNPDHAAKNNLQARRDGSYQQAANIFQQAIMRNEYFRDYTYAKNVAPPLMCKYDIGMEYGEHVDQPVIRLNPPLRSDVSMTIFISDPDTYEGGELVIRVASKEIKIKEPAGKAIIYPSTFHHRITPVTKGKRVVAITFIESAIRDAAKREIMIELQEFIHDNAEKIGPDEHARLEYVKANLQRMWQEG
jgi:PKHD-type hydroxylase